jgi:hypothetical protein
MLLVKRFTGLRFAAYPEYRDPTQKSGWPSRHSIQPQRNADKIIPEMITDKPVHIKLDLFSNSAAR